MGGRTFAARAAQISAQALTAWALWVHVLGGELDVFTLFFGAAAFALPLRRHRTSRDRAMTCFGASIALSWLIGFKVIMGLVGQGMSTLTILLLTATVLFSVAGGLFWIRDEDEDED